MLLTAEWKLMNHLFFPPASQIKKTMDDYLSTGSPLKTKARDDPCEVERLILYLSLITTRKKKRIKPIPKIMTRSAAKEKVCGKTNNDFLLLAYYSLEYSLLVPWSGLAVWVRSLEYGLS